MRKPLPTHERVKELFDYAPDTGILTRKTNVSGQKAGAPVGTVYCSPRRGARPYLIASVDGTLMRVHRIIYFYVTGIWPEMVDHANLDSLDNRWANIRAASRSQNAANSIGRASSGFKGVTLHKGRWAAKIYTGRKHYWLGYHDTPQAANDAYAAKAVELFGEFARVK